MKLRNIILQLTCLLCSNSNEAQSSDYLLETLGTREGMLSSKVYSVYQSKNRELWVGTELGLSIYNGYRFKNYMYTSLHESIGRILCITQDSAGNTWFGGDKGLYCFRGGMIYRAEIKNKPSIAIEALLTDQPGNIWVGELNALYKLVTTHLNFRHDEKTIQLDLLPYGNFTKRVFGISKDHQGNIYAASFDGIFKFPVQGNYYEIAWTNPNPNNFVRSVAVTSKDSIYWNCLDSHPASLINGDLNFYYDKTLVGRTVFSHKGKFYALTTNGVVLINQNELKLIAPIRGVTNNAVAAIVDAEDNIWIGSWEGLLKFRKRSFHLYSLEDKNQVEIFSMLEKKDGQLLFGSNRGKVFTMKNNKLVREEKIPQLFPVAEVMCMSESKNGSLWFGSGYQGIARLQNNILTNYGRDSMLKDENCEELFKSGNYLYAATEQGVTRIDPMASNPMEKHFPFKKNYTRYPELFGCIEILGEKTWFYGSQGLYTLKDGYLVDDSIDGLPVKNLYINKIVRDKKGNAWIATEGKGVLQCGFKNARISLIRSFDQQTGAPSDIALSILVDKNNNIWWADFASLSFLQFINDIPQITSFTDKDGMMGTYYQTLKLEQQRDGNIWGLTSMGAFSFHPDSIIQNDLTPALSIDNVKDRNGKEYSPFTPLVLSYNQNGIQFNYTGINLTDPGKVRYAYRLIGADSNWIITSERQANFNSVRAGSYQFEIKASKNSNTWSEPLILKFTVRPPFWQTWLFKSLVILLLVGIIYGLFQWRIRSIKTRAAIRLQMSELESKALRAQMNPHFIFNSLNAIQELVITKNFDEAYQYLSSFSKLLRLVLHNSEKNFIPLSDELEMNRLYLALESLRFKKSFQYEFTVDESIDEETTEVPSLILQPFLENAIWHGLMPKDGLKKLSVHFSEEDSRLVCTVEDNGIGRERAQVIKAGKLGAKLFESKGLTLSQQRIESLNQQLKQRLSIKIIDLKDSENIPLGTRVIIYLPKSKNLSIT